MTMLSSQEVLSATGGKLLFGTPNGVTGFSIDSRHVSEGEYFIALKGVRFDGHDFINEALINGSGALVSIPPVSPPSGRVIIYVRNTLRALQDIARYMRQKNKIKVLGITGTNGKTTTKEMSALVLGQSYSVLKNTGNLNNHIGLPLSLLKIEDTHNAAVLEMGASMPGDIKELCDIADPDYAILTNIGHAHILGFKDIDAVRRTKLEIMQNVKLAAVNADDKFMMQGLKRYPGKLIKYGINEPCDVYATDLRHEDLRTSFVLHYAGETKRVNLQVGGVFNVYNALAAACSGIMYNLDAGAVVAGLEAFKGVPMRREIKGLGGATVISDVYNANPSSMEEALKELVRLRKKRAVAVLGDMLELGSYSQTAHRRLGKWMAGVSVDLFIAVGPEMWATAEEFKRYGGTSLFAKDSNEARALLMKHYDDDDMILVKGSRSMHMECVVDPESSEYCKKKAEAVAEEAG